MGGLTGDTGARAPRFQCREGDLNPRPRDFSGSEPAVGEFGPL